MEKIANTPQTQKKVGDGSMQTPPVIGHVLSENLLMSKYTVSVAIYNVYIYGAALKLHKY